MDKVRQFIDLVAQGDNVQAKETVEEILSARAFDSIESMKKEVASTLYTASIETE